MSKQLLSFPLIRRMFSFRSPLAWLALFVIGILVVGAVNARTRQVLPRPLETTLPAATTQPETTLVSTSVPTARITIMTIGFDPEEMTLPAGSVPLAVDNRSGLDEVVLRLDRDGGERLVDVQVDKSKVDWHGTVELTAGQYTLTEANHPEWACHITVQ